MPETTAEDGAASAKWTGEVVGSPKRVQAIMVKFRIAMDRVKFHRGWFDQNFPGN